MKAIWYDRTGPAREVLQYGDLPTPAPGQGQALIRIKASGVNPSDVGMRGGPASMAYPRITPNSDGAGIVEAVGPGVAASWVGKRVWFYNGQRNGRAFGSAAEYIELDTDLLSVLPDSVSFAQGATLGIPCMTAHRALFLAGPVQGRTVLVTGKRQVYALTGGDMTSEPVFTPRSADAAEGDGWITAVVWRAAEDRSDMLVFEALDIAKGPIAVAELPRRVPFGFHGNWVAG